MEKDKETPLVLCMLMEGGHVPATVGIEVHCVGCSKMVWLSDSTVKAVKKLFEDESKGCSNCTETSRCKKHSLETNPPAPLCLHCGTKRMDNPKPGEELKLMGMTDDQAKDILEAISKLK